MLIAPKPTLNLLTGWQYLFNPQYRREVRDDWHTQPGWIIASQVAAGVCSVLFPIIVIGMLTFVVVSRHF